MVAKQKSARFIRGNQILSVALAINGGLVAVASAQSGPAATSAQPDSSLPDIVVTAQKREQLLQDVPIAVTALTGDALVANRVLNVEDLSGLAPNVVVRPAAGGTGLPSFSMRGVVSYGVVPGSDKEVSIYVDGVYISSPNASTFNLPDIDQIEVLRGPQGTLFGRNATAGAINVTTRAPSGNFGVTQEFTVGNYDEFRSRTTLNTAKKGPLSAYLTFVYDQRRGDIKNLGAGTVWDRTGPDTGVGVQSSPEYLGNQNPYSWFAAVRFEPTDNFRMTYKFDHLHDQGSPNGSALLGVNANSPLTGPLLAALIASQTPPTPIDSSGQRPSEVNNSFTTNYDQRNTGHSITSELTISDNLTLKDIAAYRSAYINSGAQIDGLGGLTFTPQAVVPYATLSAFSTYPTNPAAAIAAIPFYAAYFGSQVGNRFLGVVDNSQTDSDQWSNELQLNYDSHWLTLTTGVLWFESHDISGAPPGLTNTFILSIVPADGRLPLGNEATSYNHAKSYAGYEQAEVHLTPQLDLVLGARLTKDIKTGTYVSGGVFTPGPNGYTDGTFAGLAASSFVYSKTKPTYAPGLNYKLNDNTLVYGKYSTAFVSGGAIGPVAFQPETVESWEVGIKTDAFNRRLRANLALFRANYKNLQSAQSGENVGYPALGTVIIDQGTSRAKGLEAEVTALPLTGVTLGASLGYTDVVFESINPILLEAQGGAYQPTLIPKWTAGLSAQYETLPLFGNARLLLRSDANWRSKEQTIYNPALEVPSLEALNFSPQSTVVNARAALRGITIAGLDAEIALWARNLNNNKAMNFPIDFGFVGAATFQQARTYGADLTAKF